MNAPNNLVRKVIETTIRQFGGFCRSFTIVRFLLVIKDGYDKNVVNNITNVKMTCDLAVRLHCIQRAQCYIITELDIMYLFEMKPLDTVKLPALTFWKQ